MSIDAGRLSAARRARAWSQLQLACEANVSPSTISNLERGRAKIQIKTLARIAAVLRVDPDDLQ